MWVTLSDSWKQLMQIEDGYLASSRSRWRRFLNFNVFFLFFSNLQLFIKHLLVSLLSLSKFYDLLFSIVQLILHIIQKYLLTFDLLNMLLNLQFAFLTLFVVLILHIKSTPFNLSDLLINHVLPHLNLLCTHAIEFLYDRMQWLLHFLYLSSEPFVLIKIL